MAARDGLDSRLPANTTSSVPTHASTDLRASEDDGPRTVVSARITHNAPAECPLCKEQVRVLSNKKLTAMMYIKEATIAVELENPRPTAVDVISNASPHISLNTCTESARDIRNTAKSPRIRERDSLIGIIMPSAPIKSDRMASMDNHIVE